MNKLRSGTVLMLAGGLVPGTMWAQTHVVQKPETVVRAIAVYEWTGEESKPTASRVVPVSIYINSQLEDAGVYLARPVPLALEGGTVFEVERSGMPEGTLEVAYQRHIDGNSKAVFDDGWIGYGALKLRPKEPVYVAKKSGPPPQVVVSGGRGPQFSKQPDATQTDADAKRDSDRHTAAGAGTTVSADPAPADDPDRPTMHKGTDSGDATATDDSGRGGSRPSMRRRTDSNDTNATSATDKTAAADEDDPDRPTLKKRTPAEAKTAKKQKDQASVASVGSLNDDPDRPTLHRGAPAGVDTKSLPPLNGIPAGMQQRVAVSDAKDRPEHDFRRQWGGDAERGQILAKMQAIARAQLMGYGKGAVVAPAAPSRAAGAAQGKRRGAVAAMSAAVAVELKDEALEGYTLSYGGAATYAYMASSAAASGEVRYVSVVAQQEPTGELKTALVSVTDSKHLDRTPWMRVVDAVDAEASNRASLLVEMRGDGTRQFALYRVIGAKAEQTFSTGTTE